MNEKNLSAKMRENTGTSDSKKMRREGLIPAVVYSKEEDTKSIFVVDREFEKLFRKVGTSGLFDLTVEGITIPALVKDVQRHPVKGNPIHIDFQQLDLKKKIKLNVPLSLTGKDSIKLQPSVLYQILDEIEVECLPTDIPEHVSIDVSDMTFDTPLYVKDLDINNNENVNVLTDLDEVIATLNEPSAVEEDEVEAEGEGAAAADVPVVGEEKGEE